MLNLRQIGKLPGCKFAHARRLNIARRHINQAQIRELIADQLMATPELGDRHIAGMLGVHHTTVSTARHELVVTGEISQLKKTFGNAKLAEFLSRSIPLAIELAKQPIGQWVRNSLWLGGRFQVLLGNISCRGCFIHQHMIPGLVLWRPRARDLIGTILPFREIPGQHRIQPRCS